MYSLLSDVVLIMCALLVALILLVLVTANILITFKIIAFIGVLLAFMRLIGELA